MSVPSRSPLAQARPRALLFAVLLLGLGWALIAPRPASAEEVNYSSVRAIALPPSASFKTTESGGDGWALAFSENDVYNVYHHSGELTVACHLQASGANCFPQRTITDGESHNFATLGHPEMYLDHTTGKLYVYATRANDETAGVVCIDTARAVTEADPFCGFTALTPSGQAPLESGHSGLGTPMLVGNHWYSFNMVAGVNVTGVRNELLCFDVATDEACEEQPFDIPIGEGNVSAHYAGPANATISGRLLIPLVIEGQMEVFCFDDETQGVCSGTWPVAAASTEFGSPYPLLNSGGTVTGFCLAMEGDPCFTFKGEPTETPAFMSDVILPNDEWNGPAVTIGTRVYVPNGNVPEIESEIACFDYATGASCAHFPKTFTGLEYLYTVTRDPNLPSCLWVNSDSGEEQIQDFDATTGEACGGGAPKAFAAQFIAHAPKCTPTSFTSLKVVQPARSSYTSGTISFTDGNGNPITALGERPLDSSGQASLSGLEPVTEGGLPQFIFSFKGDNELAALEVQLKWRGIASPECEVEGITSEKIPPPPPIPPPAPQAVLACTQESLALTNVAQSHGRVRLEGVARQALVGKTVQIELQGTGKMVASALIGANGKFTATASLPPAGIRGTNRARYEARVGKLVSLPLKLYRRMYVTRSKSVGTSLRLEGRVTGKFKDGAVVAVFRRQSCGGEHMVGRTHLGKGGRFSLIVPNTLPPAGQTAVYRARTTVYSGRHTFLTYTLPTESTP